MTRRITTRRNEREVADSRRMLAADTLNAALRKDRISMQLALNMLAESHLFSAEEREYAEDAIARLDVVERSVREVYGEKRGNEKAAKLHVHARSLAQEIDALRESAFWLLDGDGVLAMERLITQQIGAYDDVRRLVRIIVAKDTGSLPEDPTALPQIGASRYLALTHPETRRQ